MLKHIAKIPKLLNRLFRTNFQLGNNSAFSAKAALPVKLSELRKYRHCKLQIFLFHSDSFKSSNSLFVNIWFKNQFLPLGAKKAFSANSNQLNCPLFYFFECWDPNFLLRILLTVARLEAN
jgi:hypothetical protein